MKLELRRLPNPAHPSREVLLVTDENGTPLPGQREVSVSQGTGVDTIVTLQLIVDGKHFRLNTGEEAGQER